ncbi:golvesin C-terminal-like domain-containing protein [Planifilum fimeticola]
MKEQTLPYDPESGDPRDKMTYEYDAVGNLTKVSAPPSAGQSVRVETTYTYFDNGWVKSSTDPWDITTTYDYNELGLQTSRTLTSAGGSSSRTMGWSYYPDGKLKARSDDGVPVGKDVVLVDNSDTQNTETTGNWTKSSNIAGYEGYDYQYNGKGTGADTFKWILHIPKDGNYTVYVKYMAYTDRAQDAPYTIEHANGTTEKRVNQTQNGSQWVSLGTYTFRADRTWTITLSDNFTSGNVVVADAVKLVRDNSGETDNEKKQFEYTYDANGNLIEMTDGSSGAEIDTYKMSYTELNQIQKVEEIKDGTTKHTTTYEYDANGNPVKRTHDGKEDLYEYTERNELAKVTNKESSSDSDPDVTTFTYTPNGWRQQQTKPNGNTVDYTYYLDGLLKHQVEKKSNGTIVNEHTLKYNANGHRTEDVIKKLKANSASDYLNHTMLYEYDPRDRITKMTKKDTTTGNVLETETYKHDANGNVIEQTVDGITTTYTYDRNRLLSGRREGPRPSTTTIPSAG